MLSGIALGSNLGDRLTQLRAARQAISALPGVGRETRFSRIYETEPVGSGAEAGAFLNAVIEVDFIGEPTVLMDGLQTIEASFGRPSKRPRNAPRIIDLDILYVGNLALRNDEIVIPHPRLHLRRFVLQPLADIRPELILPGHEHSIAELLTELRDPAAVTLFPESLDA